MKLQWSESKITKVAMTKSQFADRDTIGTMSLKALECKETPCVGDLGHELLKGLVEDLNFAFKKNPFDNKPYYVTVHEKKDLQMKNVIRRRVITTKYRPYPEPGCQVWWIDPVAQEVRFCWEIPHWSAFPAIKDNPEDFHPDTIEAVKAYQGNHLEYFGFKQWQEFTFADPHHKDKQLKKAYA
jgi:hypothetical protein